MKLLSCNPVSVSVLFLAGLGFGCSPDSTPNLSPSGGTSNAPVLAADVGEAALTRGRKIVTQAGKALSGVLLEAIREGGPTNALPLCSVQAIPLTASLAQANQVQLRRVSHRPRNPDNQASEQEIALIQRYVSTQSARQPLQPVTVANDRGAATFYAPIVITANLCLKCHGALSDTLDPEIVPVLATLYPADEATGFALGDLRGLWRIDFPPDSLTTVETAP